MTTYAETAPAEMTVRHATLLTRFWNNTDYLDSQKKRRHHRYAAAVRLVRLGLKQQQEVAA
jgi:hypothetical protein